MPSLWFAHQWSRSVRAIVVVSSDRNIAWEFDVINLAHYDANQESSELLAVDDSVFGAGMSYQLLRDACLMYDSNLRVGTAKTKTRAEVQGSSKKLYKQKGTGRARAGNRRTPVRVGGGHAFAKRPRNWYYRLPKKSLHIATRMAIRYKMQSGSCFVVDSMLLASPKTRLLSQCINKLGLSNQRLLIVTPAIDATILRASNNISNVTVASLADLNASAVIRSHSIVFLRQSLVLAGAIL